MDEAKTIQKTGTPKLKGLLTTLVSLAGLILVVVVFEVWTQGRLLSPDNMQSMINQFTLTAIVAIGATCTYGVGNFDVSLGACVCGAAVAAGYVAIATGSLILGLLVCIAVSLILGIIKGVMAAYVQVPYFIFSVVLGSVISAAVLAIMGSETTLYLSNAAKPIREFTYTQLTAINLVVILVYFCIGVFLFRYSGFGIRIKMLGGNEVAARQAGINVVRTRIFAFLWASVGIALGAFLLMLRSQVVAYNTASTTGTDVMVAITLGGMALSGGPKTKISAGLIGAVTIIVLNSGLAIVGLDVGERELIRGVIFLAVVAIVTSGWGKKGITQ